MNDESKHTVVGALVLGALALGVTLILALEGVHLRAGITIHVELERIGALQEGKSVRIAGLELGTIERIRLEPHRAGAGEARRGSPDEGQSPQGEARRGSPDEGQSPLNAEETMAVLDLFIEKRHAWLLRTTSEFFVNQQGLIGEPYLEVAPSEPSRLPGGDRGVPLTDGATVRGVDPPRLDRLLGTGYQNVRVFMDFMKNGFPEIAAMREKIADLEKNLAAVEPTPGAALGTWVAAGRAMAEGKAFLAMLDQAGVTPAELGRLGQDASHLLDQARARTAPLGPRLDAVRTQFASLAARTDDPRFVAVVKALDQIAPLVTRTEQVFTGVQAILDGVNRGEGSLGGFLHDGELGDEMKAMMKVMKTQPWKAAGHPQDPHAAHP